jgi:hypothetical protein
LNIVVIVVSRRLLFTWKYGPSVSVGKARHETVTGWISNPNL